MVNGNKGDRARHTKESGVERGCVTIAIAKRRSCGRSRTELSECVSWGDRDHEPSDVAPAESRLALSALAFGGTAQAQAAATCRSMISSFAAIYHNRPSDKR